MERRATRSGRVSAPTSTPPANPAPSKRGRKKKSEIDASLPVAAEVPLDTSTTADEVAPPVPVVVPVVRRRGRPSKNQSILNATAASEASILNASTASEIENVSTLTVESDISLQTEDASFSVNDESSISPPEAAETSTIDDPAIESITESQTVEDATIPAQEPAIVKVEEPPPAPIDENTSDSVEMQPITSIEPQQIKQEFEEKPAEPEVERLEEQMSSVAIEEKAQDMELDLKAPEPEQSASQDVGMEEVQQPEPVKSEEIESLKLELAPVLERLTELMKSPITNEIKVEPAQESQNEVPVKVEEIIEPPPAPVSETSTTAETDKITQDLLESQAAFLYDFQDDNIVRRSRRLQSTYVEPVPMRPDRLPSLNNSAEPSKDIKKDESTNQMEVAAELEPLTPQFKSKESEAKCKNFEIIRDNIYLKKDKKAKKEGGNKTMKCDCTITEIERLSGKPGCQFNCINRLLYIECGSKCRCGEYCDNQQFQRYNYAPCSVFETDNKGFGIRALEDIAAETFLIEYVGELLDNKQFEKRAKKYSEIKNEHFYFMALKTNSIIDATKKGNISRFINHSCDPNAETQKWTVNNELRIGFFSIKDIKRGEEITFDYQYQRYGKEAQKCYCEAASCRGWIGENPIEDEYEEDTVTGGEVVKAKGRKGRKPKAQIDTSVVEPDIEEDEQEEEEEEVKKEAPKKIKKKKKVTEDLECEIKIIELEKTGLKNNSQTILFARTVQRVKTNEIRSRMLAILSGADNPCQRLFLDYRGLEFLYVWMTELNVKNSIENLELCVQMIDVFRILPITNKTILKTSRILDRVEKLKNIDLDKKKLSKEERKMLKAEKKKSKLQDQSAEDPASKPQISHEEMIKAMDAIDMTDLDDLTKMKVKVKKLASELLVSWENLKEDFKIPKKRKQEAMIQHQLQADHNADDNWNETTMQQRMNEKYKSRFGDDPSHTQHSARPFPAAPHRGAKQIDPQLSKLQRRKAFEKEILQKDTEKKVTMIHENNCQIFGLNPYQTIPLDVPVRVNRVTGDYITIDGRIVPAPPNHNQFKYEPLTQSTNPEDYVLPPMDLPEHWTYAIDEFGRIFYYHVKIRQSQWNVPQKIVPLSVDESSSDEDEDTPDSDESTTDTEDSELEELTQLLAFLKKKKTLSPMEESSSSSFATSSNPVTGAEGDEDDLEKKIMTNMMRNPLDQPPMRITPMAEKRSKKKRHGLTSMQFIGPRTEADKIAARIDNKKYKELKEKLRQKKRRILKGEMQPGDESTEDDDEDDLKLDELGKPKFVDELEILERASARKKMEMDRQLIKQRPKLPPSEDPEMKRRFRDEIICVVSKCLQPYRLESCEKGRILNDEDFTSLMSKLTYSVLTKELKYCQLTNSPLKVSDSVRGKSKEYIKKYMSKFGGPYYRKDEEEDFASILSKI